MTQRNGPVGSPKPSGPSIRITDVEVFRSGTKIGSVTIILEDCGLAIHGCLLHISASGERWTQLPSRAYLKSDSTRAFETVYSFASKEKKRAFNQAVFAEFDAYRVNAPPVDVLDKILNDLT